MLKSPQLISKQLEDAQHTKFEAFETIHWVKSLQHFGKPKRKHEPHTRAHIYTFQVMYLKNSVLIEAIHDMYKLHLLIQN